MRRKRSFLWLIAVTALCAGPLNTIAFGALVGNPTAGPAWGVDDDNTSTIHPLEYVSTIITFIDGYRQVGVCPQIETAFTAYETARNTSTNIWTHVWASVADEQKVEAGIHIIDYNAWVVHMPAATVGDGKNTVYPANNTDLDRGGALLNLTYNPAADAPAINNLHWVQALEASYVDAPGPAVRLDNRAARGTTPFYDTGGAAGSLPGGGGWFLDRPFKVEPERLDDQNPVANLQFQVVLSGLTDTTETVDGKTVTTHAVTLYGGVCWGYTYEAHDPPPPPPPVPLPGALGLGLSMLGGYGAMLVLRKRPGRGERIAELCKNNE